MQVTGFIGRLRAVDVHDGAVLAAAEEAVNALTDDDILGTGLSIMDMMGVQNAIGIAGSVVICRGQENPSAKAQIERIQPGGIPAEKYRLVSGMTTVQLLAVSSTRGNSADAGAVRYGCRRQDSRTGKFRLLGHSQ